MSRAKKVEIDWLDVRQRMARAQEATDRVLGNGAQRGDRSMQERARLLAMPLEQADSAEYISLVAFRFQEERYAVEARYVREIFPLRHTTPLPLAPEPFIGLANLRGEILPVVDLGLLVGLRATPASLTFAVALGLDSLDFAIAVTAMDEILQTPVSTLQQSGPLIRGHLADWQLGVTSDATIVLDAAALLADQRLAFEAGRIDR